MRRRGPFGDEGAMDLVGTLLMVALVVALGTVVAAVAAATLQAPPPVEASFELLQAQPGDATLRVLHAQGPVIALDDLRVTLARNGGEVEEVPRANWTSANATHLRPGDRLALDLSPAAVAGERLSLALTLRSSNTVAATLAGRVADEPAPAPSATLAASLEPGDMVADGVTTHLLRVHVSHPEGALAVSRVVADLGAATRAAGAGPLFLVLADEGGAGDEAVGDGVWSGLVTLPPRTPRDTFAFFVNATDASGRPAGSVALHANVIANGTVCMGCSAEGGTSSNVGTRIYVPTSENITKLRINNWTTDRRHPDRLDEDHVLFRVVGGTQAWSVLIRLQEHDGLPYATEMRTWSATAETVYVPANMTGTGGNAAPRLLLDDLSMDLLDPVGSLQWVHQSGNADPEAGYRAANVTGAPVLVVAYMGHDQATGNAQTAFNTGIFSFDLEVAD